MSGAQKKKRNKEKYDKEKEFLRKVPKLDFFFAASTSRTDSSKNLFASDSEEREKNSIHTKYSIFDTKNWGGPGSVKCLGAPRYLSPALIT